MADVFTKEKRSEIMKNIKSKNTKPEILIRKALHRLGFRFRLHVKKMPGNPDIVLSKYKVVIQVKGCFWHGHNCIDGHIPKSRIDYWQPKLLKNKKRDEKNNRLLRQMGWKVINVWECKINKKNTFVRELNRIYKILKVKV